MITERDGTAVLEEQGELPLLTVRHQLTLTVFWFALLLQSGSLLTIVIPAQVLLMVNPGAAGTAQQAVFLSRLSAFGSLLALLALPLVGALSDRTKSRFGRRRPWILAGTAVMLAGMAVLAVTLDPLLFFLGFTLVQIGGNGATAAYQGLLPDRVPQVQRGMASGFFGLMTILGTLGSLILAGLLLGQAGAGDAATIRQGARIYYAVTGLVLAVSVGITALGVREMPLARHPAEKMAEPATGGRRRGWRSVSIDPWLRPWRSSNFTWVFLTRAFVIAAITLFATYSAYYFANVLRVQHFAQEAALIGVVSLLGALISAPTLGKLSDRLGRVPFVCLTTSCMALAALVFSLAPPDLIDRGGLVPLLFIGLLFGVGYGGYTSVDWALAIDVLPSLQDAAKDLGIWSISSSLPAAVAPLLGGLLLGIAGARHQTTLGYRGVYALATLFLMLAAGFILMVREDGQA